MKSKTYKITLVIEAAIAALIAFCLAFFGPLSLNDMTYGEFDMQVFELCFTYPAIIIFRPKNLTIGGRYFYCFICCAGGNFV